MHLIPLFFFSLLSLNLLLVFAAGVREPTRNVKSQYVPLYPWVIIFISTFILWFVFANILEFAAGFLGYLLLLPVAVLIVIGLEKLYFWFVLKNKTAPPLFVIGGSYTELAAAQVLLTLRFAPDAVDAIVLGFAFSVGGFLMFIFVKEIQKRSSTETIPYGLRGTPISIISMGLLALIFSAASILLIKSLL